MIKRMIKDQIRKTGMVRELEIKNEALKNQLILSEKEKAALKHQLSNLKIENRRLSSQKSELVGYSLKTNLRGLSPDEGKPTIMKYILENIKKDAKILDVGFGSGVYGKLLRAFYYQNIDGIDVYDKNIHEMGLDKIYNNIFIENIMDFDFEHYDLIIMGDVLEHIELESAKELLLRFIDNNKCSTLIVSIPYEYEQGELYGNSHERHLQDKVTGKYMKRHYPYLKLIDSSVMVHSGSTVAVYVWNDSED
ncbi:class I SAM-dependent methyltransferase [Methanobacterium aggregans]|uniref:class I SAM-dependent methyltransferase n=1 Tax=Methanobacterium aggregans TaxID=1615586 RepID=UPI001AE1E200|nr:methyltransferase domain-containing protein [Methanobacterium aggregans]MBP2046666.1 2-polyprenyl-3-methyl-5-hydroxy-6-metoxy-1,4-benzoquinol methylase [Methanobacterium aggregans]